MMLLCFIFSLELVSSDDDLCTALRSGCYERAQKLIDAKADVNATCIWGQTWNDMTPLHIVANERHGPLILSLLGAKARTDVVAHHSMKARYRPYHFYINPEKQVKDVSPLMQLLGNNPSQEQISDALRFALLCDQTSCIRLLLSELTPESLDRHGQRMLSALGQETNHNGYLGNSYSMILPHLPVHVKQAFLKQFKNEKAFFKDANYQVRKWVQASIDGSGPADEDE